MSETLEKPSSRRAARHAQTPAMRQWAEHKKQAEDAILLFRMGDFYETFHDDAKTVARVLGLTLTSRNKGDHHAIPLAGIPYHALDTYLPKLVQAGFKVAISEQVEDPKLAKGVVKREIVRVVTPGTLTEDHLLEDTRSNYLVAIHADGPRIGAACLELSSGDFFTLLQDAPAVLDELARLRPAELLINEEAPPEERTLAARLQQLCGTRQATRAPHDFDVYHAERRLQQQFGVTTMEGFGYPELDASLCAAGAVLAYLAETQKSGSAHIVAVRRHDLTEHVQIGPYSWQSLEVERTLRSGGQEGTLLAAVDRTVGAMGGRRLRHCLRFCLRDPRHIRERQEALAELLEQPELLKALRELLRGVGDIERITARLGLGRCSPRDLLSLGHSLQRIARLQALVSETRASLLVILREQLGGLEELGAHLERALSEEAPLTVREGGIFADGFDAELDRLRSIGRDGQKWLAEYQAVEATRTGIPSLKVGYNKVFGYYIEVTNTHRELVPAGYVRKQTIKNAERYITDELKRYETEVLTARDKANDLEYKLFEELKGFAVRFTPSLLQTGRAVGTVDMLAGFAQLAAERGWVRPQLVEEPVIEIEDGRHPALDQLLAEQFVPNDTSVGGADHRLLILTGPNMAGKSTYIRQVALLTLLAQTGSFVPARLMRWGVVDRIFARVGAGDELARGQSTFMVEMIEAANILHNAGPRSLVVLDELGRGTSTYDGLSLAWAICEDIATRIGCRTLFATHYHELTELSRLLPGVKNYNVAVREWPDDDGGAPQVVFLYKIVEGGTDKSYGVHVARIAGVPQQVVERSRQVLRQLESGLSRQSLREVLSGQPSSPDDQLELFAVQDDRLRQTLLDIDLDHLTPLQALQKLKDLQDEAR